MSHEADETMRDALDWMSALDADPIALRIVVGEVASKCRGIRDEYESLPGDRPGAVTRDGQPARTNAQLGRAARALACALGGWVTR